ncbi:MAG: carbohydrate binding family 9 domain-containing protein, partial [Candidatus Marinimicrobia bacterium]|nr:carbohydrate binding family 9 domain-containing protein [Candidatus Neomarinimicrobiota bacterium]
MVAIHWTAGPLSAQATAPVPLQRLTGLITLDGLSDEAAWEAIVPQPLVMSSPTYLGAPTERTEIRIAYDNDFLYAAARFYDSDPSGIRGNALERDGLTPAEDAFGVILDTFNDNENALGFVTNPAGLREDWAIYNDAESDEGFPINSSWNTFWDVAVVRTQEGWFAEMRIPFSSLRFQDNDGQVVMG